ncbi:MAG: trypsin-like peptidase domain-containing protein [Rhodocyclales bacterium]|nr:trypsin-like peptidase domain-containing protein [Rhodocyclales bacterium]
MADKQSLYELLGLSDKASPEDIHNAHEALRRTLDAQPDSEEKHNRIAILQDARDVLLDRRQRAGYDRRQRDRRHATDTAPPARSRWPALVLLLMLAAAYPAWRHLDAEKPVPAVLVPPAPTVASAQPTETTAISADIVALLPTAPAAPAREVLPQTAPNLPAEQVQNLPRPVAEAPHAATLMKIADSTFAIVGAVGFGTGVLVEPGKLLTNCHVIAPNVLKGPIYAISAVTGAKTRITEAAFLITEDACVVHAPGLNGEPAAMGEAGQLARGTPIFNIGFADGRLIFSAGKLLGVIMRGSQSYLVSSNHCDVGVSGGPLVDAEGRLVGLTSGGPADRSFCLSLTAETARRVLAQTPIAIDAFPPNYLSNLRRHW